MKLRVPRPVALNTRVGDQRVRMQRARPNGSRQEHREPVGKQLYTCTVTHARGGRSGVSNVQASIGRGAYSKGDWSSLTNCKLSSIRNWSVAATAMASATAFVALKLALHTVEE